MNSLRLIKFINKNETFHENHKPNSQRLIYVFELKYE